MTRFADIVFSTLALLFLLPLFAVVVCVLRFSGEGEIFYEQVRIGKDGRHIRILKFATMKKNSPNIGAGTITLKEDPRVLRVGRFLRSWKINELPQLINILRGDMSIIGPRPQTERCFNAFPPRSQKEIIKVRPGLSGVGSIVFRMEDLMLEQADVDDFYDKVIMPYKGSLEEWYVSNRSTSLFFLLIIFTVWVLIFRSPKILWYVFPSLPYPPEELKAYFYFE